MGVTVRLYARDGATVLSLLPEFTSLSASVEHNGVGALAMTYPRGGLGANALLAQDTAYLAVIDNGTEVARYLFDEDSDDPAADAAEARPLQIGAVGVAQVLEWAEVVPPDGQVELTFTNTTAGGILATLIAQARQRGAFDGTRTPMVTASFTSAVDSAGVAWPDRITIPLQQFTSLLAVTTDLAEKGLLDWAVRGGPSGLVVDAWVADTARARDRPDVRLVRGRDLLSAPRRRARRDVRSVLYVAGDAGTRAVTTDDTAVARWGRREGNLGQSGISDPLTLARIGAVAVRRVNTENQGHTASYRRDAGGPVPFADYRTGDYVRADWIAVSDATVDEARRAAQVAADLAQRAGQAAQAARQKAAADAASAQRDLDASNAARDSLTSAVAADTAERDAADAGVPAAQQRYTDEQTAAQNQLDAAQQNKSDTDAGADQARTSGDDRVNTAQGEYDQAKSDLDVAKRSRDDTYRRDPTPSRATLDAADKRQSDAAAVLEDKRKRLETAQRQRDQLYANAAVAQQQAQQRLNDAQAQVDRLQSPPGYVIAAQDRQTLANQRYNTDSEALSAAQARAQTAADTLVSQQSTDAAAITAADAQSAGARSDAATAQAQSAQVSRLAGRWQPVRVASITCTWDSDGVAVAETELDDLFLDRDVRLARQVNAIVGGSVSTTSTPPDRPPVVDRLAPAAPSAVMVSSTALARSDGSTVAGATVSWPQVTVNADGTVYDDAGDYLLDYSVGARAYSARQTVAGTTAYLEGLPPGQTLVVRVTARDRNGNTSAPTASTTITLASDSTPPPVPSAPMVTATLGGLAVTWSGLGSQGEQMPPDFDHVEVHVSTTAGFTAGPATLRDTLPAPAGIGTSAMQGLAYTSWYVRLVAVDRAGNRSAAGAVTGPTTPTRVGTGDLGVGAVTAAALGVSIGGLNLVANSGFEAGASPAVNLLDAASASFVANGQPSIGRWHPAYGPPIFNAGIGTPFGRQPSQGFLRVKGNATDSTGFGGGLCGGAYVDISGLVVGRYYTFRVLAGNDGNPSAVNVYVHSGSTDVSTDWTVGYGFTGVIGITFLAQATTAQAYVRGYVPGPNGVFDLYLEDPAVYNGLKTLPWTPGGQPAIVVPDAAANPIWQWVRSDTNWILSDDSYSGLQSAHVYVPNATDTLLTQDIVVVAAGAYTLGAKIKRANVAGGGFGSGLQLQIPATGTSAQVIRSSNDALGLGTAYGYGVFAKGTNDWQMQWQTYSLTPGTYRIACQQGFYGTCTGDSWFDEIQFVQGDMLPSYAPKVGELLPGSVQAAFAAIAALGPDGNLAPLSVGRAALVDGAVSAAKTSLAAIDGGSGNLAANSVAANAIAAYAVTAGKIDAAAVTARELAAGSIVAGSAVIGTAAIASAQIAALDVGKLNTGTLAATQIGLGGGRFTTGAPGSSSGQRLDLDAVGLRAYNSAGTLTVQIGSDGVARFTGTITGGLFRTSSATNVDRIVIDGTPGGGVLSQITFMPSVTAPSYARITAATNFTTPFGQILTLASGIGTQSGGKESIITLRPDYGNGAPYGFVCSVGSQSFSYNVGQGFTISNGPFHVNNGDVYISGQVSVGSAFVTLGGNAGIIGYGDGTLAVVNAQNSVYRPVIASAFNVGSDARNKRVLSARKRPKESHLATLRAAPVAHFTYQAKPSEKGRMGVDTGGATHLGPMAQDLPEWMHRNFGDGPDGQIAVDMLSMVGLTMGAVQELAAEVTSLRDQVHALTPTG